MSTTSSAAPGSPLSSPTTPEPSDCLEPFTENELDQSSSWYLSMHPSKTPWTSDSSLYSNPQKIEDEQMLRLDELIEQHAYEE